MANVSNFAKNPMERPKIADSITDLIGATPMVIHTL